MGLEGTAADGGVVVWVGRPAVAELADSSGIERLGKQLLRGRSGEIEVFQLGPDS